VSVEVELKARLRDPSETLARLRQRAHGEASIYHDTYYDWPDRRLEINGRQELRLRLIEMAEETRALITFKGVMIDSASTPEFETKVGSVDIAGNILAALGLEPVIHYTKHCENFRFQVLGRLIVATTVSVPEIEGTFLEVETLVSDEDEIGPATRSVRDVLSDLGLGDDDLEPTFYIDLVRSRRSAQP
jgi:adenylate cyclase class 2